MMSGISVTIAGETALRARIDAICEAFSNQQPDMDDWTPLGRAAAEVVRDLFDRAPVVPLLWRQRLLDAGVSRETIYGQHEHGRTILNGIAVPNPLHAGRVVFLDGGRFEWASASTDDASAVPSLLAFCHDQDGAPSDIWAASPRTGQVGCLYGFAGVIDGRELFRSRIEPALGVHTDIMSWLRAGRTGVLVVNWARAVWLLRDAGPLLAADVEHGELIEAKFKAAGLVPPHIMVRRAFAEAAQ